MKSKLKLVVLLIFPFLSLGQSTVFQWGEGLTYYTGKIDTTQFSYQEIETIYNYLYNSSPELLTIGSVWKIEQMDTANTRSIDSYFIRTSKLLETMKIPKGKFWDSILVLRKKELNEQVEMKRLFIRAIKNPALLYEHFHEECKNEIYALNGNTSELLSAWNDQKERHKLVNCCPDEVEASYQKEFNSSSQLKYARLELMIYGWWNCMNQFNYYYTRDEQIEKEFEKLFIQVERIDEED